MRAPPSISYLGSFVLLLLFHAWLLEADHFSKVLLGLKSEIVDGSNSLSDWSVSSLKESSVSQITACSWSGVICSNNMTKITGLDLSSKKLSGSISGTYISSLIDLVELNLSHNAFSGYLPTEIFNLVNLTILDIGRNDFNGSFPRGIATAKNLVVLEAFSNSFSGPLPEEVTSLEKLKVLNLAGSYFEGPIPSDYGAFKSLELLHLAGNLLSGNIPSKLAELQTVSHVEIGYNDYSGNIPPELGNMSALQYLDIAQANLSGSIPTTLTNLTKLQSLFLFRNSLIGSIPPSFGSLEFLENLDLSDNLLTGSIPASFSSLLNLRLLSLMYNQMNGTVPQGIAELPSLDTLLIWNNFFSGELPWNLGQNSQLKFLDVSTNSFTGSVPSGLCQAGKLVKLILFSNKFTSGLSPILANCSSLERLRIEDNLFSGPIPLQFNLLPIINYVGLSRNNFTGGIPHDISEALNLQYFNVSMNSVLGGFMPEKIWSLPKLQNFSASSCNISGNLPPFDSCKSVGFIELSTNNLAGSILKDISHCKFLQQVVLADNRLTGGVPMELADVPNLSYVDLSHNKLTGQIPSELVKSTKLALLNISFNDISGTIPPDKKFQLMGPGAFMGNPLLCGAPLQACHVSHGGSDRKGSSEKLARILSICLGIIVGLLCGVIWYLHRKKRAQWEVVSFHGLPQFKSKDILESSKHNNHCLETDQRVLTLPTGLTVAVREFGWDRGTRPLITEFITILGNSRQSNLTRLLGFCCNDKGLYLLYDHLANGNLVDQMQKKQDSVISGWEAKYRIITGVARGLRNLHHHCRPPIPHGNLGGKNIVFDANMEPHLSDYGLKYLLEAKGHSILRTVINTNKEKMEVQLREEFLNDIYNFGEIVLEILSNGSITYNGKSQLNKPREATLDEIYSYYRDLSDAQRKEIEVVFQLALKCTRSAPSDRPSMAELLSVLSDLRTSKDSASFH